MAVEVAEPSQEPNLALVPSTAVRQGDFGEIPVLMPGLIEGRLTLMAGGGGVGKTTLLEQIARHLSSGKQLGRFPLPDKPLTSWLFLLEDIVQLTQDRSHRAAALGTLDEDQLALDSYDNNVYYASGQDWTIQRLHDKLAKAYEDGMLPDLVGIDHLRLIIGSQPSGISPNDWERKNLLKLMRITEEFGVHIIVLTHINKGGSISGTTELVNSVDTAYMIVPGEDDRQFASLKCLKMRVAPETDYALSRANNGTWRFDDQVYVSEAMALGVARDILAVLRKEGPTTLSDLVMHPAVSGHRDAVRQALLRAKRRQWVRPYRGHWEIVPGTGDINLQPPPCCRACGKLMHPLLIPDQVYHPTCEPAPIPAGPAWPEGSIGEAETLSQDREETTPEVKVAPEPEPARGNWVMEALKESVGRSRMHPLPVVPKAERDQEPWSLITDDMDGLPSWFAEGWTEKREKHDRRVIRRLVAPEGTQGILVQLDRNGSFPSACSSVLLAPNRLAHTGPLDEYDKAQAGIYQVVVPEWTEPGTPHPLGRAIKRAADGKAWIATPHMKLLQQLAATDRIPDPVILDSWTGRSNGSLLEYFYKESRKVREHGTLEEYQDYKAKMGPALRMLWCDKPSPFWRPDWRVSLVATAAVSHWVRAYQAVAAGATLVQLGNTDEAAFLTADGTVPAPYVLGNGFGQVKIKKPGED